MNLYPKGDRKICVHSQSESGMATIFQVKHDMLSKSKKETSVIDG